MDVSDEALILIEILGGGDDLMRDNLIGLIDLAHINQREELHFIKYAIGDYCQKFYENLPEYAN